MNIILCGMPRCGKSTTGKVLAEKLEWNFADTDTLVELAYKQVNGKTSTCREIYSTEGAQFFRELESTQIHSLQSLTHTVIALGGGSLSHLANAKDIRILGATFYLKAPKEILWNRIASSGIPPYLGIHNPKATFEKLAEEREQHYTKAAHIIIETENCSPQQIMEKILQHRDIIHGQQLLR